MALEQQPQLPCLDGVCMRCKVAVPSVECLTCNTCGTLWHASCLTSPPETLASTLQWGCPDCSDFPNPVQVSATSSEGSALVTAIRAIEADASLTEAQKARKRQRLVSGKTDEEDEEKKKSKGKERGDALTAIEELKCPICLDLPKKLVSLSCGHNFCLKCFQKWVGRGNRTCATCRSVIHEDMVKNPRVNLSMDSAVRLARVSKCDNVATPKVSHHTSNQDRPETSFTTERAKKAGKDNACSSEMFVTTPRDHFGPITAQYDPTRNKGVLVGETWTGREHCKQWGAHRQHIAGISGQSKYGAQSVALSGGYEDDQDHGYWFIYTGSGGRDLKGNKRTNKEQSFDQKFENSNAALRLSCKMGYPVRVVRTEKEKCPTYAPVKGVRYDGIYRIEKCWRNAGRQNFKVCRYLFIRCDNSPAPWTSADEHGDRPRPLPTFPEPKEVTDLFVRTESPSWDFDETDGCWKWMKSPPISRIAVNDFNPVERKIRKKDKKMARKKILKELACQICWKVMSLPVTAPCSHSFCKVCLEDKFAGISQVIERSKGRRTLRPKKNVMSCPSCKYDIADFVQNPQVNRDFMRLIEKLNKNEDEAVVEKEEEEVEEEEEEEEEEEKEEEEEDESQIVADVEEPQIIPDEEKHHTVTDENKLQIVADEEKYQIVTDEDEPPTKKIKLDIVALSS